MIKCPYDKIAHHAIPENLPVNYQVLTALPMGVSPEAPRDGSVGEHDGGPKNTARFCDIHP